MCFYLSVKCSSDIKHIFKFINNNKRLCTLIHLTNSVQMHTTVQRCSVSMIFFFEKKLLKRMHSIIQK